MLFCQDWLTMKILQSLYYWISIKLGQIKTYGWLIIFTNLMKIMFCEIHILFYMYNNKSSVTPPNQFTIRFCNCTNKVSNKKNSVFQILIRLSKNDDIFLMNMIIYFWLRSICKFCHIPNNCIDRLFFIFYPKKINC